MLIQNRVHHQANALDGHANAYAVPGTKPEWIIRILLSHAATSPPIAVWQRKYDLRTELASAALEEQEAA